MPSLQPGSNAPAHATWRLLQADDGERARFPDLSAVLALAAPEPVAPPNRLRSVHLVAPADCRNYFLKHFTRTQLGNRWRNAWTAPRCRHDAEREAAVAAALTARGFLAPRVVGIGFRGPASFCLLASVAGEELRARIAGARCPRVLADRIARHCGAIGAAGITLPDLSALHVFVDGEDPRTARLAVIDLHRGALRPPRRRDLVRMLRAFARSVRGLDVDRRAALRFAVLLVRTTGGRPSPRAVVSRLPPFDTHGRYDAADRAARYGRRDGARARRELGMLARVWPGRGGDLVLDVPCGRGRLREFVGARTARWHGCDRSASMLAAARETAPDAPLVLADAADLPFADDTFDGAIVFRFLHHLDDDAARRVCQQAARVSRRFVVVTFFHPVSAHAFQRRIVAFLRRRPRTRHERTLRRLDAWFAACGFTRRAHRAEAPFLRDLWIACYERRVSGS